MTKFKTAIAIAVGTLFAGAAFAQSNYSIEQRDRIEQERIDRGIESGQLTSREAARLESERARVERLERRARADGVLTQRERDRITRAQDGLGRDIYRESHDRQVANSNWRTSDRPYGWDRRNGMEQRDFNRGVRSEQFNRRDAYRGGTDMRYGRSDLAPGRQPHSRQTDAQRAQVQQAQSQRSWSRPAQTSTTTTADSSVTPQTQTRHSWSRPAQASSTATAGTSVTQQAQTQRSWSRPAQASTTAAGSSVATLAQTQRSWSRPAQASTTASAGGRLAMARQGGYSGRHSR